MPRILLAALAALILVLPASAEGKSGLRLRGTVTAVHPANNLLNVRSGRLAHVLRAPGSLARIRVGTRVELRGTTLRRHGNGSRVLARGVVIVSSVVLASHVPAPDPDDADEEEIDLDDDELEVKGTLTSLSPLAVTAAGFTFTCTVPAGVSLHGFAVGDFVEMTCDRVHGTWILRELEHEDDEDDDENCGPGNVDDDDDDDDDSSGPGNVVADDDDDDNCGPGNDDDDDDDEDNEDNEDNSGPGGGDDDD